MKYFISLFFLFLIFHQILESQNSKKHCNKIEHLLKVFEKKHYQPWDVNGKLPESCYVDFISTLDPAGICFSTQDIDELNLYKDSSKCAYLIKVSQTYKERYEELDKYFETITEKKLDILKKDSISFSKNDDTHYTVDKSQLKLRADRWLKLKVLLELYTESVDSNLVSNINLDTLLSKEEEIRKDIVRLQRKRIGKVLDEKFDVDEWICSKFLNSIAKSFDPHSNYFSTSAKKQFETSLSKTDFTFGINLDENIDGEIIIESIIPGSAAWKSNELNKGDVILKIKPYKHKLIDVSKYDIYELIDLISQINTYKIDITVRKINGSIKEVTLIKEEVLVDENIINGFILDGKSKVGYIYLPGFYTEVEQSHALGCSNDMAKEILKLKRENIHGLILDLRDNGGGSMLEAISLAGIFINEGPLCILDTKKGKPKLLKDMNRGVIYNGPLVLLVNKFSASASELLSAALQDYKRAVIVGTNTFGKSTGQIITPIDTTIDLDNIKPEDLKSDMGFVKITIEKFYRVTGDSHQKEGVVPDIRLPNNMEYVSYGEDEYANALSRDSIIKKVYYSPLSDLPISELAKKSNERVKTDSIFNRIEFLNDSIDDNFYSQTTYHLDYKTFMADMDKKLKTVDMFENKIERPSKLFKVRNNRTATTVTNIDSYRKSVDDELIENIINDVYIEETYNIINDLIQLTKN